jgi:nitroreductase
MSDPNESFDMTRLMRAADAAPSILNTKPWRFDRVAAHRIELRPDWGRHLRVIDPLHRELLISCGAALFNLRLAIRVTGHDPVVWLLPDEQATGLVCPYCGHDCGVGDLLASVEIVTRQTHQATATEQRLYEEIPRRHTVRERFNRCMSMNVQAELEEAARLEGARARLLHRKDTRRLLRKAAQIDQKLKLNVPYVAELRQWTGSNATPEHGVPHDKFGPEPASRRHPPVRDLSLAWPGARRGKEKFERPQLIALETEADKPSDWLRAGQALQRVLLTATYYGLQTSFLTQELETQDRNKMPPFESVRRWWRESAQMVIRVGGK